jgi:hypothetical protein
MNTSFFLICYILDMGNFDYKLSGVVKDIIYLQYASVSLSFFLGGATKVPGSGPNAC